MSGFTRVGRVLFVVPRGSKPPFGMSFVDRLAAALKAEDVHVEILLVRTLFRPWVFVPQMVQIIRHAQSGRFDILHAQFGTYTGFITGLAAAFCRTPFVVTFRGSDLNPVPSENPIKLRLQHACSQMTALLADAVICVSDELRSRLWRPKRLMTVIPSSTDIDRFRPLDQAACRERLRWGRDAAACVFFCGNNATVKRADLAERVRALVFSQAPDILFCIVPLIPIDDMPTYLNAADCVLFLSDYEGSPNLIREACACNAPIVTVDVGDVRSVLEGVDGCRIVERDPARIAEAVVDVARRRVRSNGRDRVLRYSSPLTAGRVVKFYSELAEAVTVS